MNIQSAIDKMEITAAANGGDYSKNLEYYMEDWETTNGYMVFAFVSAYHWVWINSELEKQGLPSVYALLNYIHKNGMPTIATSTGLEKLIVVYNQLSGEVSSVFERLAKDYFVAKTLADLLQEARQRQQSLNCP